MSELLIGAFALMLMFEGLLPFISPRSWREMFERATRLSDGQIRFNLRTAVDPMQSSGKSALARV